MHPESKIIYDYIKARQQANKVSPSLREIRDACGISSTSVVVTRLGELEDAGKIIRNAKARSIRLAADNLDAELPADVQVLRQQLQQAREKLQATKISLKSQVLRLEKELHESHRIVAESRGLRQQVETLRLALENNNRMIETIRQERDLYKSRALPGDAVEEALKKQSKALGRLAWEIKYGGKNEHE